MAARLGLRPRTDLAAYPWAPELEDCAWVGGQAQLLWWLPITAAERDFRDDHGLAALEERFQAARLDVTNPSRASVVPPPPGPIPDRGR